MYRDPRPEELEDPIFNAIWEEIKTWDINVPAEYSGHCGATGNHVCAILDAIHQPIIDAVVRAAAEVFTHTKGA